MIKKITFINALIIIDIIDASIYSERSSIY